MSVGLQSGEGVKKKSKWPDFLFTITVRFVCGTVVGGLICFAFGFAGVLKALALNQTHLPLIWLVICCLGCGIGAVFTVPRWQTPWYKRDSEALSVWTESTDQPPDWSKLGSSTSRTSVSIETIGEDGQKHEYASMEEAPPEIRSEIAALEKEAASKKGTAWSVTETSQAGNTITSKTLRQKHFSVYKIVGDDGVERTYHSLEEMPPEIRAAFVEAEKKLK